MNATDKGLSVFNFFFFFTVLENVIRSRKSIDIIGVGNQKMVQLLAGNLSSGDRSSMLRLVGVLSTPALHFALMLSRHAVFCCCSSLKQIQRSFGVFLWGL